jgi:molybdate transport system regulatory protein
MSTNNEHKVSCKVWLEFRGEPLIGKGGAKILETIKQVGSISKAAKKTGMSYRYVWNYLSKLERRLGQPVVSTFKGGKKGGGGAKLTDLGVNLLTEYKQAEVKLAKSMNKTPIMDKIDYDNCFEATVQQIETKKSIANIELMIKIPEKLTISVPKKTVELLNLQPEDDVEVKVEDVILKIKKKSTTSV